MVDRSPDKYSCCCLDVWGNERNDALSCEHSVKRSHVPNWIGQQSVCMSVCLCIWKWIFRARFISPKRPFSDWPFEFTHHIQTSFGWSGRLRNRLSLKYLHFRKNEHYSTWICFVCLPMNRRWRRRRWDGKSGRSSHTHNTIYYATLITDTQQKATRFGSQTTHIRILHTFICLKCGKVWCKSKNP